MRIRMPDVIDAYTQASIVETQIGLKICSQWTPSFMTRTEHRGVAAIKKWFASTSRSMRLRSHPSVFRKRQTRRFLPFGWKATFQAVHYPARFRFVLHEGKIAKLDISA